MRLIPGFKSITFMLMLGLSGTLLASASSVAVEYDQDKDRIRVQANNASLTNLLAQIAKKTGMTIQIDPAVEKKVSFQLPPQSLQKALQKVCKGLSYVIEYKTDANQRTVISGMKLLPEGKQDSGQLVSVAVLNARAGRSDGGESSDYAVPTSNRDHQYSGGHRPSSLKSGRATRKLIEDMSEVELEAELEAQPTHVAPHKTGKKNIQPLNGRILSTRHNGDNEE